LHSNVEQLNSQSILLTHVDDSTVQQRRHARFET